MLRIAIAINLLLIYPSFAFAGVFEGNVVKVADGDTITVLDSDKVQRRVRIAGIDPPKKGQPFGNASRKQLGELVARSVGSPRRVPGARPLRAHRREGLGETA
jgi:endonuclease YncB( thermonuclease family)